MHKHGSHAFGHLGNALLDALHGGRAAHQCLQGGVALCGVAAICIAGCIGADAGRGNCANALNGRGHHLAKLAQVHGFGQVVKSPGAQGVDRIFCRAIGRHDNAALRPVLLAKLQQQLHASAVWQAHIADHHVKALALQLLSCFLDRASGLHTIAFAQQGQFIKSAQIGLIVHDQNAGRGGCCGQGSH